MTRYTLYVEGKFKGRFLTLCEAIKRGTVVDLSFLIYEDGDWGRKKEVYRYTDFFKGEK